MAKSIIKEVFITILLLIAVVLVMAVVFYDYNPINKIVPNKVQYTTSENIKNEIDVTVPEMNNTTAVYSIDGSNLNMYTKGSNYVKGKANPFAATSSSSNVTNSNGEGNGAGGNTTTPPSQNTTKNNSASSGTFFNNTGLK